jgi:hypothetical protein
MEHPATIETATGNKNIETTFPHHMTSPFFLGCFKRL